MNDKHLGSAFDDFLREEGLLEEVEAVAAQRVQAHHDSEVVKGQAGSSPSSGYRLLDLQAPSERPSTVVRVEAQHVCIENMDEGRS